MINSYFINETFIKMENIDSSSKHLSQLLNFFNEKYRALQPYHFKKVPSKYYPLENHLPFPVFRSPTFIKFSVLIYLIEISKITFLHKKFRSFVYSSPFPWNKSFFQIPSLAIFLTDSKEPHIIHPFYYFSILYHKYPHLDSKAFLSHAGNGPAYTLHSDFLV